MKKKTPLIKSKPDKKAYVKKLLMSGRKLTVKQLDDLCKTNNSPELIRQLRKKMPIKMEWATGRDGSRYGIYSHQI